MSLFHNLKYLFPFKNTTSNGNKNKIFSKEVFHRILVRERARVDRYGGGFSMAVFDVGDSDKQIINENYFSQIVRKQIRPTDEVGWFEKSKIGIVLPDTPPFGAKKLAEEICRSISIDTQALTFIVYNYPLEKHTNYKKKFKDISIDKKDRIAETSNYNHLKNIRILKMKSNMGRIEPYFALKIPFWKRLTDIISSLLGLVLLFPLFLSISVLIKIFSPGPIFFMQKRVGFLGKPFWCYKFRTMNSNSDENVHTKYVRVLIAGDKPMKKLDDVDPRIFPFGNILRKTCLDELPQLINILKGEMSLVGPRPEIYNILHMYNQWHKKRFDVKPGLTCFWQVNGKNENSFKEMMRIDIDYINKKSFWVDTKIILKTVPAIFGLIRNH